METLREILFKAKRSDNGEWVEGYYIYNEKHFIGNICIEHYVTPAIRWFEIDPTTLSQFIGCKDRHGNKIFENDIVEIVSSPTRSEKYLIWWNREMSMITAVPLDGIQRNSVDYYNHIKYHQFTYDTFCLMMQDPWGDFQDIKVIGNLFDNYYLIKEKQDEDTY